MTNLRNKILNVILLLTLVFGSFQLYEAEGQTRSQAADALFSKNDSSSRVRVLEMVSCSVEVKVVSNN
jgi:high-affinity K+ transport system ATPase subunit B